MHPALRAHRDPSARVHDLDPFALFCAYHLGLTDDGTVEFQNGPTVARRFGVALEDLHEALAAYRLSADDIVNLDFDLTSARLDLELSPPGVDLGVLCAMHFEHFVTAPPRPRDWEEELREDARSNRESYGDDS